MGESKRKFFRQTDADVLKGIGIIMMIAGHTGLTSALGWSEYIAGFYMPMFFLVSGYFFAPDRYNIKEFVKRRGKSILVPYAFFSIFHLILWLSMWKLHAVSMKEHPLEVIKGVVYDNNRHFPIAGALWFLTCLFITELIGCFVIKYTNGIVTGIVTAAIASIGLFGEIFLPLSADSALTATTFYVVGYYLKTHWAVWLDKIKNARLFFKIFLLVMGNLIYIFLIRVNGISNIRSCEYGKYPVVYLLHAMLGIGIWWLVSYLITQISWNNRLWKGMVWVIIYIGRNSMLFA